ncbi:hypothetical protein S101446_00858 [Komagataeibacter europaeus]|nr:hypothetical protein S101446_00858 [Komagataeibacter europaeus]
MAVSSLLSSKSAVDRQSIPLYEFIKFYFKRFSFGTSKKILYLSITKRIVLYRITAGSNYIFYMYWKFMNPQIFIDNEQNSCTYREIFNHFLNQQYIFFVSSWKHINIYFLKTFFYFSIKYNIVFSFYQNGIKRTSFK